MRAEILTIGDELLIGQIIDTNAAWLGQELSKIGISVVHKASVSDQADDILKALRDALQRASFVIITGGLGPTKDDVTKKTLANFFNCGMVVNQQVLDWVTEIFTSRNLPMLQTNNDQALVPESCEVLFNRNGTAPGMWFEQDEKIIISMPGVPFEMKCIFTEEVIPRLQKKFDLPFILHRTIQTTSIGESFLAKKIASWENQLPEHIKLAYLPSVGQVRLRLSGYSTNNEKLTLEMNALVDALYHLAGEHIFGEGDETLQGALGKLLKTHSATLSTAESCTGGYLSHLITSVPGSSSYYRGSIISYANEIKMQELNISADLLEKHGAVSEACVVQMAESVKQKMNTLYSISTSGIAGPDGGTETKPVGTVWIAVSGPDQTIAKKFNMGDNRERTIHRTALQGMDMLRMMLLRHL